MSDLLSFDAADALELSGTTVDTVLVPLLERIRETAQRHGRLYSSWFNTRNRPEARGVYREVFKELRSRGFRIKMTFWLWARFVDQVDFDVMW